MHTIAIKLRAEELSNPDLDIRYVLPDLLADHSGGIISAAVDGMKVAECILRRDV